MLLGTVLEFHIIRTTPVDLDYDAGEILFASNFATARAAQKFISHRIATVGIIFLCEG